MCNCGRWNGFAQNHTSCPDNSNVLGISDNNNTNNCQCPNNVNCDASNSWCDVLSNLLGRNCTCEFLLGDEIVKRTGILSNTCQNFLALTSPTNCNSRIVCRICDLVSVRTN